MATFSMAFLSCVPASLVALLLMRPPVLLGQGPMLMTPFNLSHLLEGAICKYSHIEGLGL